MFAEVYQQFLHKKSVAYFLTTYPHFFHRVIQIVIKSLMLKNLAETGSICYALTIPANKIKTVLMPV
jgi:hypothetical protein